MLASIQEARPLLRGVLPVLHTPFRDDLSIDIEVLEKQIDWAFETGADGVVVAMVSETLRLGYLGRRELAAHVCKAVRGRGVSVISVGAESIREAIEFAKHAESLGADAVMAIPPVATGLSGEKTVEYFSGIARSIEIPLVVQDASSYVGAAIDLNVYLRLLDEFGEHRICFKPEASPLGPNLSKLRDASKGKCVSSRDQVESILWIVIGEELLGRCLEPICSMGLWRCGKLCKRAMRRGSMNYRYRFVR